MLRITALVAGLLIATACQRAPEPPAGRPDHALLRGLEAPPTNAPVTPSPGSLRTVPPTQLPQGTASTLIALRGGQPVSGVLDVRGRLTATPGRIRIEPAGDSAVELLYQLPPDLPALRADTGAATLTLVERSGPAGAARQVVLRSIRETLLAEIWQLAPTPLQFDLRNGVRLVQQPVRAPGDSSRYTEVPLDAVEGERVLARIPIGHPTPIRAKSGRWVVFAEISHLYTPSTADAGQVRGGYILRAWIVPDR